MNKKKINCFNTIHKNIFIKIIKNSKKRRKNYEWVKKDIYCHKYRNSKKICFLVAKLNIWIILDTAHQYIGSAIKKLIYIIKINKSQRKK